VQTQPAKTKGNKMKKTLIISITALVLCLHISAETIVKQLPAPTKTGGMPLMEALNNRQSTRDFDDSKKISDQTLSDLLWAGFGVNRPGKGKRTAPSSYNAQDITIYVFQANGTWLYNAPSNTLEQVSSKDLRNLSGFQDFVKTAPLSIVLVSDYEKFRKGNGDDKEYWKRGGSVDAGLIAQNINLYCASQNLGVVVRAYINYKELAKELSFGEDKMIVIAQTIGYKK
jgi:nitroreductase